MNAHMPTACGRDPVRMPVMKPAAHPPEAPARPLLEDSTRLATVWSTAEKANPAAAAMGRRGVQLSREGGEERASAHQSNQRSNLS